MASNGTILLVDNDKRLNFSNRTIFEVSRYKVFTATTLNEAHRLINETPPDIIIMETELPDGDGFLFCEEIIGKLSVEIFFLTVKTDAQDLVKGLKCGAADYLTKPFYRPELMARVDRIMQRRY